MKRWVKGGESPTRLVCMVEDGSARPIYSQGEKYGVPVVPVTDESWMLNPVDRVIIHGSRAQLMSRALNRGCDVNRSRWMIQFGLLNNDSHWVMGNPDAAWAGLHHLHRIHGTYRLSSNMHNTLDIGIPIRDLFESGCGSPSDIEAYVGRLPEYACGGIRWPDAGAEELWVLLSDHLAATVGFMEAFCRKMGTGLESDLLASARYHDWGKAHIAFQRAILYGLKGERFESMMGAGPWAKRRPRLKSLPRTGYYHDRAGGCGLSYIGGSDLAAWLVLTHHGRFLEGIKDFRVRLPRADLGGGVVAGPVDFEATGEWWSGIADSLYGQHGPFVLAYASAMLRVADIRASGV